MTSPWQLRILNSIENVTPQAWNGLLQDSDVPTLRWEWIHALEASHSACEETGWKPCHFTVWREEKLVAASPAYLKFHSMGEYVYDFAWAQAAESLGFSYYPKLLVGVPLSPMTARRMLVASGEEKEPLSEVLEASWLDFGLKHASSVHVIFPSREERHHLEARGFAGRTGMQYHWNNVGYQTYDEFLSRFDAKRRHQLKRERQAASAQGIRLHTVRGLDLTPLHARLAYRFYENTCQKNGWGQVQLNPNFFERVFATLPNHIEMVLAEKEGTVVAGAFNLVTPSRLFGRYWGCFQEFPFLHFHVCLYHSIDECIQLGRRAFEPGAGGEHKIARGFEPTEIHSAHWIFEPRLDGAIRRFVQHEEKQLRPVFENSIRVVGMKPWKR